MEGINYLNINNQKINDPIEIANTMNNYFTNIGPELAKKFKILLKVTL